MSKQAIQELLAETIGVFSLVYFGGWSVLLATAGIMDVLGVGLVHSGILGVLIWCGCAFAGCHFNPALTIGFMASKAIDLFKGMLYICAQFVGTCLGAVLIKFTAPTLLLESAAKAGCEFGGPHLASDFTWPTSSLLEFIGTFMLMFVVKTLCAENKASFYAPLIGCVIGLCVLCFGSFTGTGINPFRYLGPALLSMHIHDFFIYVFFPILGATASAFAYDLIFDFETRENEVPMASEELR